MGRVANTTVRDKSDIPFFNPTLTTGGKTGTTSLDGSIVHKDGNETSLYELAKVDTNIDPGSYYHTIGNNVVDTVTLRAMLRREPIDLSSDNGPEQLVSHVNQLVGVQAQARDLRHTVAGQLDSNIPLDASIVGFVNGLTKEDIHLYSLNAIHDDHGLLSSLLGEEGTTEVEAAQLALREHLSNSGYETRSPQAIQRTLEKERDQLDPNSAEYKAIQGKIDHIDRLTDKTTWNVAGSYAMLY
jgi:hypothetical protein